MGDLVEKLSAVLRDHKELALSDEEIKFIALIMAGFACSPPHVRGAMVPEFKAAARKSMELIGKAKSDLVERIKKGEGQPN